MGESDGGKSSVVRAIRWLALNRPTGKAFIRHGCKRVRVNLLAEKRVQRTKGKTENTCKVDGNVLAAVGKEVPDAVKALLNLGSLNFQCQHDPPFWLTISPGDVAKELNEVINLSLIDRCMAILRSQARKARDVAEISEARLRKATWERDRLNWTVQANRDLAYVEKKCTELQYLQTKQNQLRRIVEQGRGHVALTAQKLPIEELGALEGKEIALRGHQKHLQGLKHLLECIQKAQEEMDRCAKMAKEEQENLRALMGETCPLCEQEIGRK